MSAKIDTFRSRVMTSQNANTRILATVSRVQPTHRATMAYANAIEDMRGRCVTPVNTNLMIILRLLRNLVAIILLFQGDICAEKINECITGEHNCHKYATCHDDLWGFHCTCNAGYKVRLIAFNCGNNIDMKRIRPRMKTVQCASIPTTQTMASASSPSILFSRTRNLNRSRTRLRMITSRPFIIGK